MRERIDKILGSIVAFLMGIMVLNVLWQVASRYLLGSPSIFTDELANYLLIWVGLLGAAYASGKKLHLAIDLLPNKLEGKSKQRLSLVITSLVVLFVVTVMVIGGGRLVYLTLLLEQLSPSLQIPLGYIYMVIPISGIFIIYYSISNYLIDNGTN
ncbi:TRAP transporter small permease [Marinoscillum pacificum]|uniref:TRAP transporter small permease n=1 Tax=Marinoscillum pacificum TaxID=392723 RepID=UPI002157B238|nr:TRAP transporter small permease [Marinoscillum pacificum]